jgi:hypothetical protein
MGRAPGPKRGRGDSSDMRYFLFITKDDSVKKKNPREESLRISFGKEPVGEGV